MPLGSLVLVIASGSLNPITLFVIIVVVITHNLVACMRQFLGKRKQAADACPGTNIGGL